MRSKEARDTISIDPSAPVRRGEDGGDGKRDILEGRGEEREDVGCVGVCGGGEEGGEGCGYVVEGLFCC